jgi:hypothetical protein
MVLVSGLDVDFDWVRFSVEKTKCLHFCRLRGALNGPVLTLNGVQLEVMASAHFLGLLLDAELNWKEHVGELRKKCLQTLNILKVLSNTTWDADRQSLLRIYRALVRSKLDYASFIYSSASDATLRRLDTVHHSGLRIALGAFRTSPVLSLYAEAGEPSLADRRNYLMGSYVIKMKALSHHPSHKVLLDTRFDRHFNNKPLASIPTSLRLGAL